MIIPLSTGTCQLTGNESFLQSASTFQLAGNKRILQSASTLQLAVDSIPQSASALQLVVHSILQSASALQHAGTESMPLSASTFQPAGNEQHTSPHEPNKKPNAIYTCLPG